MNRFLILLTTVVVATGFAALPSTAAAPSAANGGGRGTLDGVTAFSQFGFGVTLSADGTARGHFNCLMAGASKQPGLNLMAVRGQVKSATIGSSSATFSGIGTVNLGNQGRIENQSFVVTVTKGGLGVGTLQLTLIAPLALVLPVEEVLNGHIDVG